jgi:microcystin-dependent protein
MHPGRGPGLTSRRLGEKTGVGTVTLAAAQIPSHNHGVRAVQALGTTNVPTNQYPAIDLPDTLEYVDNANQNADFASAAVATTGGGQSHNNLQPYLVLNFIIALQGVYPSRS